MFVDVLVFLIIDILLKYLKIDIFKYRVSVLIRKVILTLKIFVVLPRDLLNLVDDRTKKS